MQFVKRSVLRVAGLYAVQVTFTLLIIWTRIYPPKVTS